MINYTIAWRLRQRGCFIYSDKIEYKDVRLKDITLRQKFLMDEFDLLDEEIQIGSCREILGKESTTPLDTSPPPC